MTLHPLPHPIYTSFDNRGFQGGCHIVTGAENLIQSILCEPDNAYSFGLAHSPARTGFHQT